MKRDKTIISKLSRSMWSIRTLSRTAALVVGIVMALAWSFAPTSVGAVGHGEEGDSRFGLVVDPIDYRPAVLRLCSVAGIGVAVGTPFTYTIAPVDPTTTLPYPTDPITVLAGSCQFVNGPYPSDPAFPGVGTFNYGTSIVVTQGPSPPNQLSIFPTGIISPTLTGSNPVGTLTVELQYRRGTMTFNQALLPNNRINEIDFINVAEGPPPPLPRPRFDFDGDYVADIVLFRPSNGNWYYHASGTGSARAVHFGQAGDIPVAADFDGDEIADPAVYRNGQWFVLASTAGFSTMNFGLATDIPQAADYDGDGKADFAVYRPSDGTWYVMGSLTGFKAVKFGVSTDIPVAADFDGDGKTDPAVYRNGTWFINGSTAGFSAYKFGLTGDVPVQADYDGDGRADVAVYRGGTWYIMGSTTGFRSAQFGLASDTPVPADYDGDGKTDIGVYRSSNTNWYILNSSQSGDAVGGFSSMQFGSAGDVLMRY